MIIKRFQKTAINLIFKIGNIPCRNIIGLGSTLGSLIDLTPVTIEDLNHKFTLICKQNTPVFGFQTQHLFFPNCKWVWNHFITRFELYLFYANESFNLLNLHCLLYTSDAADEEDSVDLGGR